MELPARVGIVGLGLMGGSLARALAALPGRPRILASSLEPDDLESARAEGVVDAVADADVVAAGADLVVYATPLGATLELLEAHRALWASDAVVTDLVSLKTPVLTRARELGIIERYVGSHPVTGGEGEGFPASREGLYDGAVVWLVRDEPSAGARSAVDGLWKALGAEPRWIDAAEHDRRMVRASHLPQILANALAAALGEAGVRREELGPGGRDMTRLAGSSPRMWEGLFEHSGTDLASAVRELLSGLESVARSLEAGEVDDVVRLMERTRRWTRGEPWS